MAEFGIGAAGGPDRARPDWVPVATAVGIVGLILAPLLVGYEPIGGDPDLMYRPIKQDLAVALRDGRLPYWSDFYGLGVPLVAESHAAAFYPLNWIAYRFLDVPAAYRLLMWAHFVACAAAAYAYARSLAIGRWGSALAGVAFAIGGFQASHACHEPFYTLMPYLPLSLLMAERYLATGRAAWLAGLALAWGTQLLLGHFQIQMWTGGLVALTGLARLMRDRGAWRRAAILSVGLAWGLAVAGAQLRLTSELTRVSGFDRPAKFMMNYALPPTHLAQWALPPLYLSRNQNPLLEKDYPYWRRHATTPEEACAYIGVTALVLACVGLVGGSGMRRPGTKAPSPPLRGPSPRAQGEGRRQMPVKGSHASSSGLLPVPGEKVATRPDEGRSDGKIEASEPPLDPSSSLVMWTWVSLAALVLATMPRWWPDGYMMILKLPGFGLFRAPGRYTVLPSLGLALWAGRGLDRAIDPRGFRNGMIVAVGLMVLALGSSIGQALDPGFRVTQGASTIPWRYAASLLSWGLTLAAVLAWRRGRVGPWAPVAVATLELAGLFYLGPTLWGWAVPVPGSSPMFARLKQEKDIGLVAGRLQNLPIRAGFTVSYPIVGITAPPPNYLLESSIIKAPAEVTRADIHWQRRFGVSHGIWEFDDDIGGTELIDEGADPVLGTILDAGKNGKERQRWKLVRYGRPFPPAWVATHFKEAAGWPPLYSKLAEADRMDEAWFLPEDRPQEAKPDPSRDPRAAAYGIGLPPESDIDLGPPATSAKVVEWDGRSGTVEHDGSCVLIVRRAYYPGWRARINDGPEKPVSRVSGGLQGVVLTGRGPSKIALSYHPAPLGGGKALSLMAVAAATVVIVGSCRRGTMGR